MSKLWKPPVFTNSQLELQWINNTVQAHELFCGCTAPLQHFFQTCIKKSSYLGINKNNLQKCLTFTETTGTQTDGTSEEDNAAGPEGDLIYGELEKLFENDGEFKEEDEG